MMKRKGTEKSWCGTTEILHHTCMYMYLYTKHLQVHILVLSVHTHYQHIYMYMYMYMYMFPYNVECIWERVWGSSVWCTPGPSPAGTDRGKQCVYIHMYVQHRVTLPLPSQAHSRLVQWLLHTWYALNWTCVSCCRGYGMSRSASIMDWGRGKNVNTNSWFANTGIVEHVYMCTCTCRLFSSFSLCRLRAVWYITLRTERARHRGVPDSSQTEDPLDWNCYLYTPWKTHNLQQNNKHKHKHKDHYRSLSDIPPNWLQLYVAYKASNYLSPTQCIHIYTHTWIRHGSYPEITVTCPLVDLLWGSNSEERDWEREVR